MDIFRYIFAGVLPIDCRDLLEENEFKHDVVRTIFSFTLYESLLENFQSRVIENGPSGGVFGLVLPGKNFTSPCSHEDTMTNIKIIMFTSGWF